MAAWPVALWQLGLVALWLAVNDIVDYGLGLHPYLFRPGQEDLALVTASAISLAAILYLALLIKWPARAGKSSAENE